MTRRHTGGICIAAAIFAALALSTSSGCDRNTSAEEYKLVREDEFEGDAGASPDTAYWDYDIGTNWGNNQLEYDTSRPVNVSLDGDGNLAIVAREESYNGCDYTSGRIVTRDKIEYAYGRFEARIRLPVGQGIWPAFWLLGADIDAVGWPVCGEIDIMEYRGQEPNVILGSLHGPGYYGGSAITRRYIKDGAGFNEGFHIFAVEWSEDRVTWYLDNAAYFTVTTKDIPDDGRWVFDHPFFIILNVAVGGNFVGPPNESTSFPQTMLIDWVRVYRKG